MIDDYLKLLKAKNGSVPDGYPQALAAAESVRRALERATSSRSSPVTAIRFRRTSSTPGRGCGSSTGNIPG